MTTDPDRPVMEAIDQPRTPGEFADWAERGPAPARTSISVPVAILRDWQDENERLRRCVKANLDDARAALTLLDRDIAYDYVDNVRYNAERTLGR